MQDHSIPNHTRRRGALLLLFFTIIFTAAFHLSARPALAAAKTNSWVQKGSYLYYRDARGKKLKGMQKIKDKTYLFDKQGRQLTGWQKYGKSYYFFNRKNGRGGFMVTGKTVNHISLQKNGKASLRSSSARERMYALWSASQIVTAHTRPTWNKAAKMRAVWNWFQSNFGYRYLSFSLNGDWDVHYAALAFGSKWASCEGLGCAWAFLASACGASGCYSVTSGGHGWSEVEGLIYDPSWERVDKRHNYYGMHPSQSGVDGVPRYAQAGYYRRLV